MILPKDYEKCERAKPPRIIDQTYSEAYIQALLETTRKNPEFLMHQDIEPAYRHIIFSMVRGHDYSEHFRRHIKYLEAMLPLDEVKAVRESLGMSTKDLNPIQDPKEIV